MKYVSIPAEKCLAQHKNSSLPVTLGVFRYTLGVTHGAVSPLGILNDETHSVTVVLDREILQWDAVGVHPNDNTATVWFSPQTL